MSPESTPAHGATDPAGLYETSIASLPFEYRGKVRDIYRIDDEHWLIIATDRVSAFDVILPNVIPGKGRLLTQLSMYWFDRMKAVVPNHLADLALHDVLPDPAERAQAEGRCMIVRKLTALPVEAVVRGYLIGSGWKDYQAGGQVCGIELPAGLRQAERLGKPIFTPASKAAAGEHDENITFDDVEGVIGRPLAEQIRSVSLELYLRAAAHAEQCGLIIADTKFEFGVDADGSLVLMDEILTPDSSRFWEADTWALDTSPASYDKQFVRDWLETLDWDKTAPGPAIPQAIIDGTLMRYSEAVRRLTN